MKVKPEFFREQASRMRGIAAKAIKNEVRDELIAVAIEYDRLAEEAEKSG